MKLSTFNYNWVVNAIIALDFTHRNVEIEYKRGSFHKHINNIQWIWIMLHHAAMFCKREHNRRRSVKLNRKLFCRNADSLWDILLNNIQCLVKYNTCRYNLWYIAVNDIHAHTLSFCIFTYVSFIVKLKQMFLSQAFQGQAANCSYVISILNLIICGDDRGIVGSKAIIL